MAGGGGTRFWPLSTSDNPKQLLNLTGKTAMVNEAILRLQKVVKGENVFIVTNKIQAPKMLEITNGLVGKDHILTEAYARNTSACIGYSAIEILKKYGDGVMVVTPSDAYIKDEEKFARILSIAIENAEKTENLYTIGIKPTFPATGYGYIKFEKTDGEVKKVEKFVEKPCLEVAEQYFDSGDYVWNSGMFVFKASTILSKFKKYLPDIYVDLIRISECFGKENEQELIDNIYGEIRKISIDYGIMEKSNEIFVIPGDFGWNDVGSLDMLEVLHTPNKDGNVLIGETTEIDCKNVISFSSGRHIALIGLEDVIVVETDKSVLVCAKERAQDVKYVVEKLKEQYKKELI